jgi:hypothetical protein
MEKISQEFPVNTRYFQRKVDAGERSKASLQKYERSKELLMTFTKKQYSIENLPSNEISNANIYNLESFLKYESHFKGRIGI